MVAITKAKEYEDALVQMSILLDHDTCDIDVSKLVPLLTEIDRYETDVIKAVKGDKTRWYVSTVLGRDVLR